MEETANLVKYNTARHALADCRSADEVLLILDKAAALRAYAAIAKDKSLETDATEIRIRAERRLGEMLIEQKATVGLNQGGRPTEKTGPQQVPVSEPPTLAEAGISKNLSSRAQKLASVPPQQFEEEVAEWKARVSVEGNRVTSRLEAAGERELARTTAEDAGSDLDPSQPQEAAPCDRCREMGAMIAELQEDNESMARVFDGTDQVAAAMKEAARFREMARVLDSRVKGLTAELHEMSNAAKSWKRKFEKLQKEAK